MFPHLVIGSTLVPECSRTWVRGTLPKVNNYWGVSINKRNSFPKTVLFYGTISVYTYPPIARPPPLTLSLGYESAEMGRVFGAVRYL